MSGAKHHASAEPASAPILPAIGDAFAGAYFAGRMLVDGKPHALIVAPKAAGETTAVWKTDWLSTTPGAGFVNDGRANTDAMIRDDVNGHPAANWVRGLAIGGYIDWYVPSRDELELLYRNFKPTADRNWTYPSRAERWRVPSGKYAGMDDNGNGHNASSLPPGAAYGSLQSPTLKSNPVQTTIEAFCYGHSDAFEASWYWSSTEFGSADAWGQGFGGGDQTNDGKYYVLRVRAVRKVLI